MSLTLKPPSRIISLALFRHPACGYEQSPETAGRFFQPQLAAAIAGYLAFFPGWRVRIHHDESLYSTDFGDLLCRLEAQGKIDLVYMGTPTSLNDGSLWRIAPAWDKAVPYDALVICRDADSMPTPREAEAVQAWADSGMPFHVIHDSPSHSGIMTGMIGFRAGALRLRFADEVLFDNFVYAQGLDPNVHENDQVVLNRALEQEFWDRGMWHRRACCTPDPRIRTLATMPDPVPDSLSARLCSHVGAPFDGPGAVLTMAVQGEINLDILGHFKLLEFWEDRPRTVTRPVASRGRSVVLASDHNLTYAAFLPIVARAWSVIGLRALVLLVGNPADWHDSPPHLLVLKALRRTGALVRWVRKPPEARETSTVAQAARLAAGSWPGLDPGEYILTADADMIPCRKMDKFLQLGNPDAQVHLFYANAYSHEAVPHFPLCYVGMSRQAWAEMFGAFPTPEYAVLGMFGVDFDPTMTPWDAWNFDEKYLSAKVVGSPLWPGHVQKIWRDPSTDRVDRAWWDKSPPPEACVDCHALRPLLPNWDQIRPVVASLGEGALAFADGYIEDLRKFQDEPIPTLGG